MRLLRSLPGLTFLSSYPHTPGAAAALDATCAVPTKGYQGGLFVGMLRNPELATLCGVPLRQNDVPMSQVSCAAAPPEFTQSSRHVSGRPQMPVSYQLWGMTAVASANATTLTDPCPNGGVSLGQWEAAAEAAHPLRPSTPATCSVKVSAPAGLITLAAAVATAHPHDVLFSFFNGQNNAKNKRPVAQRDHRPNQGFYLLCE